jgi:hypothetical protein
MALGVTFRLSYLMASGMPVYACADIKGCLRVTSLGEKPVPPVLCTALCPARPHSG